MYFHVQSCLSMFWYVQSMFTEPDHAEHAIDCKFEFFFLSCSIAVFHVQHVQHVQNVFKPCKMHVFGMYNFLPNKKHEQNMLNMPEHAEHAFNHAKHAEHATAPWPYLFKR